MTDFDFYSQPAADRMAKLQADRASHERALEELQPFLDRADQRLAQAQSDYDAASRALGANQLARHGAGHAANDTWDPRQLDARRAAAEAESEAISGAWQFADAQLATALSQRNALTAKRSEHLQQVRLADVLIASTEAELERERTVEQRQAAALQRIRDGLVGAVR